MYLNSPMKFKAPEGVSSVPESIDPEKLMNEFNSNRNDWKDLLAKLPEDMLQRKIFRHPISGRMNLSMTLDFMKHHSDRHFKQIKRLLN